MQIKSNSQSSPSKELLSTSLTTKSYMVRTSSMSYSLWSFLLLALAAALCTRCAATDDDVDDASNGSTDTDTSRRARAAATAAEILSVHNTARQAVGVPPLVWSPQIAGYAKGFAHSRRGDCAPRRSPLFYFGENIFVGKGRHWNATALAAPWVAEGQWYDYETNSCAAPPGAGCLRYTQVVWRNTTRRSGAPGSCATPATPCSHATTSRRGTTAPAGPTDPGSSRLVTHHSVRNILELVAPICFVLCFSA